MSERIAPVSLYQTSSVVLDLPDNLPPLPARACERAGGWMHPRHVRMDWLRGREATALYVSVTGPTIRRDGTVGVQQQYNSVELVDPAMALRGELTRDTAPEWLLDLIDRYAPPQPALRIDGDSHA